MVDGAVVFAGGGLAGIAWELGVMLGLEDAEPGLLDRLLDPRTTFVGTSAGSAVASQIAGGTPLEDLYAVQLAEETAELGATLDLEALGATFAELMVGATSPEEMRRRVGAFSAQALTVPADDRRAVIAARLPNQDWSTRRLLITAVDTATGELRIFDRDSGVDLVDAVAASCAVPGVWPPVPIEGALYMDGGVRSIANADLAVGADRVLVLVPAADVPGAGSVPEAEIAALAPAEVLVAYADEASLAAFGANALDPAIRPAAAMAGREQGRALAPQVAAFWR
ncbi:patatin-like phospholipase family protein [soil metagenome]